MIYTLCFGFELAVWLVCNNHGKSIGYMARQRSMRDTGQGYCKSRIDQLRGIETTHTVD